jgi:hypothetical protein
VAVLLDDGTVRAWGVTLSGSSATAPPRPGAPASVKASGGVRAISACDDHSLALLNDGTASLRGQRMGPSSVSAPAPPGMTTR